MLSNVSISLAGYVQSHPGLRLIENRNCIIRRASDLSVNGKVKLLSGGGSGHEPAHIGYVGHGMLDGAICGDVFCSPSAAAIVDCLRAVAPDPDEPVLFIVNNYTGDRLNFGLALEMARTVYGYRQLRMLLNDDDCSISDDLVRKSVGKRGLAGKILLIKMLGSMAELGGRLDEIYEFGDKLLRNNHLRTFGFTFESVDGKLRNIELGKGLHGEPGVYTMAECDDFKPIVLFTLEKLKKKVKPNSKVIVLVNNLGGTSEFLVGVFLKTLLDSMKSMYDVQRIYTGTFFSSLDQTGLSVTLLNQEYSEHILSYLDYRVEVASKNFGNSNFGLPNSEVITSYDDSNDSKFLNYHLKFQSVHVIRKVIERVCKVLLDSRDLLNTADKECGDGDTGTTLANGAEAILSKLNAKQLKLLHPASLLQDISQILHRSIGGTSGAMYSLFFQAASKAFVEADAEPEVTIHHWLNALSYGNAAIQNYALTDVGDRTMLDPLKQAEIQLKLAVDKLLQVKECVKVFAETCKTVALETINMIPKSGRAAYTVAAEKNVSRTFLYPDPGAEAVAIWAKALFDVFEEELCE
ncbi:triokinase/FMN cyclase-like [Uranotaenia lowii]|uniref:triokinase/FMN cyclase-like n=1 Tax=Uranotaenia lowii TaxID=190385 RepID=UPI00247912EC|nr:triokinase/FMN cyclase-like [Uranotaenia lowii]